MTANAERGEIEIDIDGVPHVLRPSYEALLAIEKVTGRGLVELAIRADEGVMTMPEAAAVVTECIRAQGKATGDRDMQEYRLANVGEALIETGLLATIRRLQVLLLLAVNGGYTGKGERRARATAAAAEPTIIAV